MFRNFLLSNRFSFHELFKFYNILITIKSYAVTFTIITTTTTGFLVVTLDRLGYADMGDEAHVRPVDPLEIRVDGAEGRGVVLRHA